MKHFLLSAFLCLFSTVFYAQKDKTIYLDSLGAETNQINHVTYRIIKDYKKTQKRYMVMDYYKSGKIKSEGMYTDNTARIKAGFVTEYYENGNMKSKTMYNENLAYGEYSSWHENGNKAIEGEYIVDNSAKVKESHLKINNYWDADNIQKITDGNGFYTETEDTFSVSGELKSGLKTGLWTGNSTNPVFSFKEIYKDGQLIEGTSIDTQNMTYSYVKTYIYAEPTKGMSHLYKQIASNVITPFIPESVETTSLHSLTSFTVTRKGEITEVATLKGINETTDYSTRKAIQNYKGWKPAINRGIIVDSKLTLPLTIQVGK